MLKPPTRTDALLHPVRIRIVMALQDNSLNAAQIASLLGDVPLTTLYRHLNVLLASGTIAVSKETPIHGAVEREFRLVESATYLDAERDKPTGAEILGLVNALTDVVRDRFSRYVAAAPMPPPTGEISLLVKSVYLTDAQHDALRRYMMELIRSPENWKPSEGRRRRLVGFFAVPETGEESSGHG
ncbi:MAG: helix-turn-helix domain-containing protein [Armatimonadetes bacterium]|nr:helix-turn-helix domain-containing protein [Armatimonadota bacterium]